MSVCLLTLITSAVVSIAVFLNLELEITLNTPPIISPTPTNANTVASNHSVTLSPISSPPHFFYYNYQILIIKHFNFLPKFYILSNIKQEDTFITYIELIGFNTEMTHINVIEIENTKLTCKILTL